MRFRIFTDGGSFKKENGLFRAVSSYLIYKDLKLLHGECIIHEDRTNNYAEIYSIAKALLNVKNYIKSAKLKKFTIEIYSDSLLCIKSLTQWIYTWIPKAKNGVFYNSVGNKVANQELIKEAFNISQQFKGMVKFYHINSHKPISQVKTQHKHFKKFNKSNISFDDFMFAYLNNKKCDELIKETHDQYLKNKNTK